MLTKKFIRNWERGQGNLQTDSEKLCWHYQQKETTKVIVYIIVHEQNILTHCVTWIMSGTLINKNYDMRRLYTCGFKVNELNLSMILGTEGPVQ